MRRNYRIMVQCFVIMFIMSSTLVNVHVSSIVINGSYIEENESSIRIGNDYIELVFDKNTGGGIDKIIDKKTGIDLRPDKDPISTLFLIWIFNGTSTEGALNWQSIETEYYSQTVSDFSTISIINSNLKGYDIHTTTTITIHNDDQFVEMRLTVENNEDFIIEKVVFPVIWGLGQIGSDSSDDTLYYPTGDGILLHDPLSKIENLFVSGGIYPGTLSMQLLCHFDKDKTGLYFATYDTKGNPKSINYGNMQWDGMNHLSTSFEFYFPEYEGNDFMMDYDLILGTFNGDWYEAASMYKKWAETTPFVDGGKINETKDIPDWFDDTSIIQLVNRDNPLVEYLSLADIVDTTNEYSQQMELDTTVLIIGWEHYGAWVGPYYYPPVEGEQAFRNAMNKLEQNENHGFTYVSGTVWRITRDDIGYADYNLFNSTGLPWVALQKDQTPYFDPSYEPIGWHSGRMCAMTDFWHDMVVYNALESVRLGCDIVQIDEFPIGAIYPCYNASHDHTIGYSNEISYAYQSILEDIRTQGRSLNTDFIMSTEEPCEFYLPYIDTYVSRDCAPEGLLYLFIVDTYGDTVEFIPFFSYVYHEYVTSFGEGIGMDEEYATGFYYQMARALAKMFASGEIMKVGGTTRENWDMDLFDIFKRTATATTTYAKEYVLYGVPLTPPELDVPDVKIDWYNAIQGEFGTPIHEPVVFNSAWRADDGTKGFVFINWYTSTVEFNVELNDGEFSDKYGALKITRNGETTIIDTNTTLPTTLSLSLEQNDIVLIEIIQSIDTNHPDKPKLNGPKDGKINEKYSYQIVSSDPDNDHLYYYIDWGDNTTGWFGPYQSEEEITVSYSWVDSGTYDVKVKAKDEYGAESEWSDPLSVSVPKNKILNLYEFLFGMLIERFPLLDYFL